MQYIAQFVKEIFEKLYVYDNDYDTSDVIINVIIFMALIFLFDM
jgi:hypothetical protein